MVFGPNAMVNIVTECMGSVLAPGVGARWFGMLVDT